MYDEDYIKMAIKLASEGTFPYGAVIVKDGEIVGKASSGEIKNDPTAHAETTAIRRACAKLNTSDLYGATIYSSCEPCLMCFGALWWSNIRKIVYAASISDSIAGDDTNSMNEINISIHDFNKMTSNDFDITGGILKEEAIKVMQEWKEKNDY